MINNILGCRGQNGNPNGPGVEQKVRFKTVIVWKYLTIKA